MLPADIGNQPEHDGSTVNSNGKGPVGSLLEVVCLGADLWGMFDVEAWKLKRQVPQQRTQVPASAIVPRGTGRRWMNQNGCGIRVLEQASVTMVPFRARHVCSLPARLRSTRGNSDHHLCRLVYTLPGYGLSHWLKSRDVEISLSCGYAGLAVFYRQTNP